MAEQNTHSLDAAVEETIELAHQVIEQTRAEIARSQALSGFASVKWRAVGSYSASLSN
jgi:predicted Zn-dependent protease